MTAATVSAARADDKGALCTALQGTADAMNKVMGGKSLLSSAATFRSISADCGKRTLSMAMDINLPGRDQSDDALKVMQAVIDKSYCSNPVWRGLIDRDWTVASAVRFSDNMTRTFSPDCTGIPKPADSVAAAAPGSASSAGHAASAGVVDMTGVAPAAVPQVTAEAEPSRPGSLPAQTLRPAFALAGKPVIVYEATGLNPDCSVTGPVVVRVPRQPEHGAIRVVATRVFPHYLPSNVRSVCNSRRASGYRVFYQSRRGFVGSDTAEFEVFWPAGQALDIRAPISVR